MGATENRAVESAGLKLAANKIQTTCSFYSFCEDKFQWSGRSDKLGVGRLPIALKNRTFLSICALQSITRILHSCNNRFGAAILCLCRKMPVRSACRTPIRVSLRYHRGAVQFAGRFPDTFPGSIIFTPPCAKFSCSSFRWRLARPWPAPLRQLTWPVFWPALTRPGQRGVRCNITIVW